MDLGIAYRGVRLVGNHKTLGGFVFGILCGVLASIFKFFITDPANPGLVIFNLDFAMSVGLYTTMSVAALSGDIIKSVVKRFAGVPPHEPWIPFDEVDHTISAMIVASIFIDIPLFTSLTIIISYLVIHIMFNLLAYFFKMKNVPY